jgi:hypothetical protein
MWQAKNAKIIYRAIPRAIGHKLKFRLRVIPYRSFQGVGGRAGVGVGGG